MFQYELKLEVLEKLNIVSACTCIISSHSLLAGEGGSMFTIIYVII
jgi:hypothetical protein